jgi:O-antigen ligase
MPFVLTLLYITFTYIPPAFYCPGAAEYRVQLWIACITCIVCIPLALSRKALASEQSYALLGLALIVPFSRMMNGWFGGTILAFSDIMPSLVVFLFVVLTCTSQTRIKVVITALFAVAVFYVAMGTHAYFTAAANSPYVLAEHTNEQGQTALRIQALSVLGDPNDFAQFLLMVIPLWWAASYKPKKTIPIAGCYFGAGILIFGVLLTHSRGGLIGISVLLLLVLGRKIGYLLSSGIVGVFGIVMFQKIFSAGRSFEDSSAINRLDLWAEGLHYLRSNPLFGIGYGQFTELSPQTAHNSFVLCFSELGFVGYCIWLSIPIVTMLQLRQLDKMQEPESAETIPVSTPSPGAMAYLDRKGKRLELSFEDRKRWARALIFSLTAYLVTAWFLSRTFVIHFWIVIAIAVILVKEGTAEKGDKPAKSYLRWTLGTAVVTILLVSLQIRLGNWSR